jgi:glycerophosphoryl diester phosphodiesterase
MYEWLPKPTIFAHRGASAYAPENTIAAFELAVCQKADAIELDAKLSADGNIVVIHDQTVDRTTDGKGKVSELSIEALKELDAGEKYDETYQGEQIPTLNEVFDAVGQKTFINVELTNYATPLDSLPEKAANLVKIHNLQERILFSSFNPIALKKVHEILPSVPLGLLALPGFRGAWARSILGRWVPYQALHPAVGDTKQKLIKKCHRRGHRVYTYTVNQIEDMRKFFQWEIDGIFTDDPPLAQRTSARYKEEISQAE